MSCLVKLHPEIVVMRTLRGETPEFAVQLGTTHIKLFAEAVDVKTVISQVDGHYLIDSFYETVLEFEIMVIVRRRHPCNRVP